MTPQQLVALLLLLADLRMTCAEATAERDHARQDNAQLRARVAELETAAAAATEPDAA